MFMIKMILRKLRRRFFNYGTIMKTFTKAERRLNKYRGEMLDEAKEYSYMISSLERAKVFTFAEAERSVQSLRVLSGVLGK